VLTGGLLVEEDEVVLADLGDPTCEQLHLVGCVPLTPTSRPQPAEHNTQTDLTQCSGCSRVRSSLRTGHSPSPVYPARRVDPRYPGCCRAWRSGRSLPDRSGGSRVPAVPSSGCALGGRFILFGCRGPGRFAPDFVITVD
jgi:hypothetical protein